MARTIFVGDLHGCLEEFKALEKKLHLSPQDRVILLGDLINRGPHSRQTILHVFQSGYQCLCGNHDLKYRFEYDITGTVYNDIYKKIGKRAHQWYMNLPFYLVTSEYIAVHAGLVPGLAPDKTDANILTRIRTWDGRGLNLNNPWDPPWYELYRGKKKVFYGHWAQQGLNLRDPTFGLDSGCVYGGKLTACILETGEIVQVKAKKAYYEY